VVEIVGSPVDAPVSVLLNWAEIAARRGIGQF
jgi:hypothetical protein